MIKLSFSALQCCLLFQRSSQEYKDASDLWELFLQTRSRIFDLSDDAGDNKTKLILKVGKIVSNGCSVNLVSSSYCALIKNKRKNLVSIVIDSNPVIFRSGEERTIRFGRKFDRKLDYE